MSNHLRSWPQGIPIREDLPFSRAHIGTPDDYGGMGVGLYISSEIIKRHGGRMWLESRPSRKDSGRGKGSTFYFTLPIA